MLKCMNKKVLAGLAAAALGVLVFAPNLIGAALPLLLIAACPLSMVFMMRAMGGGQKSSDAPARVVGETATATDDARLRELEEEVNRLKIEAQLGSRDRSGSES